MKIFSAIDIGQKRQINQDFIYTSEEPVGNLLNLFVVADGMGGHNAGDFASRYGVSVLVETIRKDKNFNPVKIIRNGIEAANKKVLDQSRKDLFMSGMGTTMVALTVVGGYAYVANVGDSRLYLADEQLEQITQDHSLIAEMVRLGKLNSQEGENHPDKNIITRAVGIEPEIKIDFFDIKLKSGNQIVMCSDGLSNMVKDEEIFIILKESKVDNKAQALINRANENGGKDNIAVIVVEPFTNEVKEC
ncbi:MAG: Stp1/IreP family PP2C-type Ser/Thr phosphatase [Lachnospiraceae bacterium]|nr:Stp1/IreP family PP2C-type Ser/Thr phosphatase [Lachnospiraceae bacterium]